MAQDHTPSAWDINALHGMVPHHLGSEVGHRQYLKRP